MLGDLDHLKQINDYFGHYEGDFAITACAEILSDAWIRSENPNNDPNISTKELVSMFKGSYGNPFWFLLNAFTGTFAIILFATVMGGALKSSGIMDAFAIFKHRRNI